VVHSLGGKFRSRAFRAALKANGLVGSMGRGVAAAADSAAMESFSALLQKNVLNRRRRWRTRDELTGEIITCIDHTYNCRQRALGKLSPVAYELAFVSLPCLEDTELAAWSVTTTVNRTCSSPGIG
jgi:putative transposase